jgi:hypothetical protein
LNNYNQDPRNGKRWFQARLGRQESICMYLAPTEFTLVDSAASPLDKLRQIVVIIRERPNNMFCESISPDQLSTELKTYISEREQKEAASQATKDSREGLVDITVIMRTIAKKTSQVGCWIPSHLPELQYNKSAPGWHLSDAARRVTVARFRWLAANGTAGVHYPKEITIKGGRSGKVVTLTATTFEDEAAAIENKLGGKKHGRDEDDQNEVDREMNRDNKNNNIL